MNVIPHSFIYARLCIPPVRHFKCQKLLRKIFSNTQRYVVSFGATLLILHLQQKNMIFGLLGRSRQSRYEKQTFNRCLYPLFAVDILNSLLFTWRKALWPCSKLRRFWVNGEWQIYLNGRYQCSLCKRRY